MKSLLSIRTLYVNSGQEGKRIGPRKCDDDDIDLFTLVMDPKGRLYYNFLIFFFLLLNILSLSSARMYNFIADERPVLVKDHSMQQNRVYYFSAFFILTTTFVNSVLYN